MHLVKNASANRQLQIALHAAPAARMERATLPRGDVKDETGLTGFYDGKLEYDMPSRIASPEFSQESALRDALVSQLGLILEPRKTIGKALTVRSADSVPTEN